MKWLVCIRPLYLLSRPVQWLTLGHLNFSLKIMSGNFLISKISAHDVSTTLDRMESILKEKGMGIFGRVDHAANAEKAGLSMPATQVLIFGNPKMGTPLMLKSPSIAVDLPLKMMATESDGQVTLSWTDPLHLKALHQIEGCDEIFDTMAKALDAMATAATA